MAYDIARSKVVIYGGYTLRDPQNPNDVGIIGDTWEWDGATRTWTHIATADNFIHVGLWGPELAYDPNLMQVILFGGQTYFSANNASTYAFNGINWYLVSNGGPVGRTRHAMATDIGRSKVLLFGGGIYSDGSQFPETSTNDTWEWDGTVWTQVALTGASPSPRTGAALTYDISRNLILLFGGNPVASSVGAAGPTLQDTWHWDGTSWEFQPALTSPSPRWTSMAYDIAGSQIVLFGGNQQTGPSTYFSYNGGGGGAGSLNDTYLSINDATSPDTMILSAPPSLTNSTSATFTFTSNEPNSTFKCALDGGVFATCPSPQTYNGLAEGIHTLEVRAADLLGNTDQTPATYTWTIDIIPPETTITSNPPATTTSTSAIFQFTSTEAGSTFACSLDGSVFTACTSPQTYNGLANGSHTFQVRAIDAAGNFDTSPASYTWTINLVDATPPDTTITSFPANPTNSANASFSFVANEAGSTFACSLDGAAFALCASPANFAGLTAGSHTFRVRATDAAGNTDLTPASYTWTIDLTAPNTSITSNPPASTNNSSATFGFSATQAGSTFTCSLDGGVFVGCTSPTTYTGLVTTSHTFRVRATDPAGNTDATPATYTWTVDVTPPNTTITAAPAATTNKKNVQFKFTSTEAGGSFQCSLDGGASVGCDSPTSYNGLTTGNHSFQVRAIDAAGNVDASPASFSWTIQ